jgi:hypothetical protein
MLLASRNAYLQLLYWWQLITPLLLQHMPPQLRGAGLLALIFFMA